LTSGSDDNEPREDTPEVASSEAPVAADARVDGAPRHFLARIDAEAPRVLLALTILLLAMGWHLTWPDLNRDFNNLHGWADCQDAHMARMHAEEGGWKTGFRPVEYRLHDATDAYRYAHYGILTTSLVSLVFEVAPPRWEHLALRLAGIGTSCVFLAGLYLLARRLFGQRFAAWALFFGALSPQVLYFGAFPASYVIGNAFAVFAFWAYVAWREGGRRAHLAAWIALLLAALFSSIYLVGATLGIGLDFLLNRALPERRRVGLAVALALLPGAVLAAQALHYRYGVEWITGHVPWGSGVAQNIHSRTHFELLGTFSFYSKIVSFVIWAFSPAALIGFASFLAIDTPRAIRHWRSPSGSAQAWRPLFVAGTLGLAAIAVPFPQSTLTHDFTWTVLLVPMALMAAAFMMRTRSVLAGAVAVVLTSVAAFAGSHELASRNNSPPAEWELGVGLRLATPKGSFVRIPWDGALSTFMLDYYAHRELLPRVPDEYRAVVPEPRFVVEFPPIPDDAAAIYVPGANETIVDRSPGERTALPATGETYRGGTWELVSSGLTGQYGGLAIVELEWRLLSGAGVPPSIEIGQRVQGAWTRLGTFRLRGNGMTRWPTPREASHRDGFLVTLAGAGPILLRFVDPATGGEIWADSGRREVYIDDAPGATHDLPE